MKSAARSMSGELKGKLDSALDLGPLAVALVGFLGVGREGLETAIFFSATARAAGAANNLPLLGWAVGLGGAVLLGWLIYRGALQINLARFFRWAGAALVLVAGGILSCGTTTCRRRFLQVLNNLAFDVYASVDPTSWYAVLLKGTVNFTPQTTWLQSLAWVLYVGIVLTLFLRPARPHRSAGPGAAAPAQSTQGASA